MTTYKFTCASKTGEMIVGRYEYHTPKFNRDELMQRIMGTLAEYVTNRKIPWDPFNIELIVKAQKESKP